MEPGIEHILKRHITPTCSICYEQQTDVIATLSCCHTFYHLECIKSGQEYTLNCPNCERFYDIITEYPLTEHFIHRTWHHPDLLKLYSAIYKRSSSHLYKLDRYLRRRLSVHKYSAQFQGYYDAGAFKGVDETSEIRRYNITTAKHQWTQYTYGIFRGMCWDNIVSVGATLLNLNSLGGRCRSDDDVPIHMVVYTKDYRLMRTRVEYLLSYIKEAVGEDLELTGLQLLSNECVRAKAGVYDLLLSLEHNNLAIRVPGMSRKIYITMAYTDNLCEVIHGGNVLSIAGTGGGSRLVKEIKTYGCIYDGTAVYMTIKRLLSPNIPKFNYEVSQYGYKDTPESFLKRTGITCVGNIDMFFKEIYKEYMLEVTMNPSLNAVSQLFLQRLCTNSELSSLITIKLKSDELEHISDSRDKKVMIQLVSADRRDIIHYDNVRTCEHLCDFVRNVLYKRMRHTRIMGKDMSDEDSDDDSITSGSSNGSQSSRSSSNDSVAI